MTCIEITFSILQIVVPLLAIGVTIWIYLGTKAKEKTNSAKTVVLQIEKIEKVANEVKSCVVGESIDSTKMASIEQIFVDDLWEVNKQHLVGKLNNSQYIAINDFYSIITVLKKAHNDIIDSSKEQVSFRLSNVIKEQLRIDLQKSLIQNNINKQNEEISEKVKSNSPTEELQNARNVNMNQLNECEKQLKVAIDFMSYRDLFARYTLAALRDSVTKYKPITNTPAYENLCKIAKM